MTLRTPAPRPRRRTALGVGLVAGLVPWVVEAAVLQVLLGTDASGGPGWFAGAFSFPLVLEPLGTVVVDAAAVHAAGARGWFRSDRWWWGGGVFVMVALVARFAVGLPTSGEAAFLHVALGVLSGFWILTFALGALAWRRVTPTFVPTDWLRPPDPEDL